jgi:thiamine biosynthesis protein ThiS
MKLKVNGIAQEHTGRGTLAEVVAETGARPEHVAVLLNGAVVPRGQWGTEPLREGDTVDILAFMGGG